MTSYPPPPQGSAAPLPPPPVVAPVPKLPPVAWVIPLAALLAVIGAFIPWFEPHDGIGRYRQDFGALYSFNDAKIGLVAPIVLVIVALGVASLARGTVRGRLAGAADPVRAMAKYAIGAGAVSLVCLLIAWFLVTTQYKFELNGTEYTWGDFEDKINAAGGSLSRGPQPGYWLTIVGALLAIGAGAVMLVRATSSATAQPVGTARPDGTAPATPPPPPWGYPPAGPSLDEPAD